MKKLCRNIFLLAMLLVALVLLPVQTNAETPALSEYVDVEHLTRYIQREYANGNSRINLLEFNIPVTTENLTAMENLVLLAVPDLALCEWSVGLPLGGDEYGEAHLLDVVIFYSEIDPQIRQTADVLLRGVEGNDDLSDLEKTLLLHDRLALWCEYDREGYRNGTPTENGENAYGALVERFCVGEGYSRAYRYLLARAGVASDLYVTTTHTYNVVYFGDKCYRVDVAWDDEGGYGGTNMFPVSHDYFLRASGSQFDADYENVWWPERVFFVDGELYGYWDGVLYRQEDTQMLPLGEKLYVSDVSLELNDRLLSIYWDVLYLVDVHTGEQTPLCTMPGKQSITLGLDYRGDRVSCLYNDQWLYPFEGTAYTVTYKNWNGQVLQSAIYEYGQLLRSPEVPQRAGYRFSGWDRSETACSGDLVLTAQFTPYAQPDGWFEEDGAWYYREADLKKTGWHAENGNRYYLDCYGKMITGIYRMDYWGHMLSNEYRTYYFDENGVMQIGWQKVDGKKYFFREDGRALTGMWQIDDKIFSFNLYGEMHTGLFYRDGKVYYMDEDLGAIKGWKKYGDNWLYFGPDYDRLEGWQFIGGCWYYLNENGIMQTGWYKENGTMYYLRSSGAMAVGWQKIDGDWYYFNSSGAMQTGWRLLGGKWYYMSKQGYNQGKMQTGMCQIDGASYYFDDSGAMHTGWLKRGDTWYYFASSGAMRTGWLQQGSIWYYFTSDGKMVTGFRTIDNVKYYFKDSGAMATGWFTGQMLVYKLDGTVERRTIWYYANSSGALQTGWMQQGSIWYYFDRNGVMATGRVKIGNVWYNFAQSGAWIP